MIRIIFFFNILLISTYSFSEITVSVPKPWNGYWWPLSEAALVTGDDYRTHPAPIEKYDGLFSLNSKASDWELTNRYIPDGESWFGYCNGWAAASVSEPEPTETTSLSSFSFFTGDQKGLLSAYYQRFTYEEGSFYGSRYNSEQDDFSDIDPFTFFIAIEEYLNVNGVPILMDDDPGIEIWTYPIYKYSYTTTDDGSVRHFDMTLYTSTDFVHPDSTYPYERVKHYTFSIDIDGEGALYKGENTQWTGDSVDDHPDFLWFPDNINEDSPSSNPYLTFENLSTIVSAGYDDSTDDLFEPNNSFSEATPLEKDLMGRTLDDDYFKLSLGPLETTTVSVYFNDFHNSILASAFTENEEFLDYFSFNSDDSSVKYTFSQNVVSHYFFNIEYFINNQYTDNYKIEIEKNFSSSVIPHTVEPGYWTNFVLSGFFPDDTATDSDVPLEISSDYGVNGLLNSQDIDHSNPIGSFVKNTFTAIDIDGFSEFPDWIKVNTENSTLDMYSFYLSGGLGSLSYLKNETPVTEFLFAHVPNEDHYWWYGMVFVNPHRFESCSMEYTIYSISGTALSEGTITLASLEKKVGLFEEFFPGVSRIESAYISFKSDNSVVASALYGSHAMHQLAYIPVQSETIDAYSKFYIPLNTTPSENNWTGTSLVNNTDSECTLDITFLYKNGTEYETSLTIPSHSRWVGLLSELLPPETDTSDIVYMEGIPNGSSLYGFALCGDQQETKLASLPILKYYNSFEQIFPYIDSYGLKTFPRIINMENADREVYVGFFDNGGTAIAEVYVTLSPYENKELILTDYLTSEELDQLNSITIRKNRFLVPYVILQDDTGSYFDIIGPDFEGSY